MLSRSSWVWNCSEAVAHCILKPKRRLPVWATGSISWDLAEFMCVSLGSTRHLWRDWMGSSSRSRCVFPLQAFRRTRGRSILGLLPYGPYPTTSSNIQPKRCTAAFDGDLQLSTPFITFHLYSFVSSLFTVPKRFCTATAKVASRHGLQKTMGLGCFQVASMLSDCDVLEVPWQHTATPIHIHCTVSCMAQLFSSHGLHNAVLCSVQCCARKWPPLGISTWARCARPGLRMHSSHIKRQ